MRTKAILAPALIGLLTLLMAAPQEAYGQGSGGAPTFRQEELDQMLAPIALYPDSLLANVLVAATYPIEIVQADRWVKQNKNLKGEQLNAALDKMEWDLSVKALAPFPQVLGMMSDRLDWTQKLGDAFLAQQADVMDTVQKLRGKAQAQGNLKTTKEQNVIVEKETIVIEPANPTVVYVPAYNPEVVYGSWWYPSYPPYAYYPAGYAFAGAAFGFAAGVAVGAAWNHGWGHWDWGHHDMNVNINRNANINRNSVSHYQSGSWRHDSAHRGGVAYRNNAARERYGQKGVGSADARRDYRGFSGDAGAGGGRGAGQRPTADQTMKSLQQRGGAGASDRAGPGSGGRAGAGVSDRAGMGSGGRGAGVSDRAGPGSGGRPGAGSTLGGSGRGAFGNMDSGGNARMSSDRGRSSRDFSSMGGGRGSGGFQGGRGFSGGSRGGGFSGGGRGGGGGFGGGGRSGGGGRGGRR